jgi:hypothetical protein
MKLRTRIAAVLSGLTLVAGLGVATAGPASALTTRQDISFEGGGFYLGALPEVGAQVAWWDSSASWDYQAEGSAGGDGTFYYLHPHGYDSLCMTASTTQFGVIKIETCVAAQQQYWWNPHNSSGYYQLYNAFWGAFLNDPSETEADFANLTFSCYYGYNGCTFSEPA